MTTELTETPQVAQEPTSANPALSRRYATSASAIVVLSGLAAALNYGSNLVFGRLLSPSSYGELTALLALVVILTVPTGAAQTLIAERLATLRAEGRLDRVQYLIRHGSAHVMVISVIAGALFAAAVPLVVSVFHISVLGPALATIPLLVASFFIPFSLGILQGLERFKLLGVMLVASAASRLVFGIPWMLLANGGAGGALGGQALGNFAVVIVTWWAVRDLHLPRGSGAARAGLRRRIDRRAFEASMAFVAFALMSNLDIVLAKAFLTPAASGRYAALVTIEKIVLFLPAAVAYVMVPNAARARVTAGSGGAVLRTSSLIVLSIVVLAAIPAAVFPNMILGIMFGPKYQSASAGVAPILVAGAAFALLNLLVVYTVAVGYRRSAYLLLAAVPFQVGAIALFHGSSAQIATVQAAVALTTLIVNELLFHPLLRSRRLIT